MTTTAVENEIDLVIKMRREADTDGWQFTASIDEVPEAAGYYGLEDGLRGIGGGVTLNMRSSLRAMTAGKSIQRPIYKWKADTDGSATAWLNE